MKTNIGLAEHAKKALQEKWGYVYGTFGTVLTDSLLQQKLKQYPNEVGKYLSFIKANWLGRKVVDCVGLIKAYIWEDNGKVIYTASTDVSANGMYLKANEKGPISTIPEIPGLCVWKNGHIGIYIGNNQVIESHGTKTGVILTPLRGAGATPWTNWLKCPYIEYIDDESQKMNLIVKRLKEEKYITAEEYWLDVLEGKQPVNLEYLKILLGRVTKV
jgi:hypothetical protein